MAYGKPYNAPTGQEDTWNRPPTNTMYYQRPDGTTVPVRHESPGSRAYQYQYAQQPHEYVPPPPPPPPPQAMYVPPPPPSKGDGDGLGPIETPREKKQHLIVRILRIIFIIFQCIALLAGLALVIIGSIWYREVRKRHLQGTFFGTLPMFAIGAGVALTLLSCIGLVSAVTRGRSGAIVYSLLLVFLIGSQVYILWRTGRLDREFMGFLSEKWDEMRDEQRNTLQKWRKCCGFGGPDDRAVHPCPEDARMGCALPFNKMLRGWAGSMVKTLTVAVIVEVVLIALSLVVSFSKAKY